jgi:hypothetical protein
MNFLRTQTLMRLADSLKLTLNGDLWKTQSNLDIVAGKGITFSQAESKDLTTLTISTASTGGSVGYFGSFWDSSTQTAASTTTAYVVTLNSADGSLGVSVVGGSKITVSNPGYYNLATSIQVTNNDTQAHDATFWLRKNGTDIAQSGSIITVPPTHGGKAGKYLFYVDLIQQMSAGDYLQLVWAADDTNLQLQTIPAGVSPTHPLSPSVIVSVTQV